MPNFLSPNDRAVGAGLETFENSVLNRRNGDDEKDRNENEWKEKYSIAPEGERECKKEENNPRDTRIGENKEDDEWHQKEEELDCLRGEIFRKSFFCEEKVECENDTEGIEEECKDVWMGEGSVNARRIDDIVRYAGTQNNLSRGFNNRDDAGEKNEEKHFSNIFGISDGYEGEKADREYGNNPGDFLDT